MNVEQLGEAHGLRRHTVVCSRSLLAGRRELGSWACLCHQSHHFGQVTCPFWTLTSSYRSMCLCAAQEARMALAEAIQRDAPRSLLIWLQPPPGPRWSQLPCWGTPTCTSLWKVLFSDFLGAWLGQQHRALNAKGPHVMLCYCGFEILNT